MNKIDMSAIQRELSVFSDVKPKGGKKKEFRDPPDGYYTVMVDKAHWGTASTGTLYLNWHLKILDGDCQGQYLFKKHYLKAGNSKNFEFFAADMATVLGESSPQICDINGEPDPAFCSRLLDHTLAVKKVTRVDDNNSYNVYINGCSTRNEEEGAVAHKPIETKEALAEALPDFLSDDDIPF
tara:strand:- start:1545 stop:2090 length:546 start_codon:yes stop_codon:yes gene_type:complete